MWKSIQSIIVGSFIMSFGINNFFLDHHILDGGIIGLGLIFHYQWGLGVGTTILITSIPIYVVAWRYYRSYFYNSIPGLVVSALFIDIFSFLTFDSLNFGALPSALIGGLLLGLGVGYMFRYDISTGGLDLLGQMISKITTINIGIIIFVIDTLIIFCGIFVITPTELLLSTIAVTATGFATTLVTLDKEMV